MSIPITHDVPTARHARAPKKRLWLWIVLAAIMAGVVMSIISTASYQASLPKALPEPPMVPVPTAIPQPTSSATAAPTPVPTDIPAGQVTQIYLPATDPSLTINDPVLQSHTTLVCNKQNVCERTILPPEEGPDKEKVFQYGDYAMAGTNSTGNIVLAGHASNLAEYAGAAFNKLRDQVVDPANPGSVLVGHHVWIHTKTSGNDWLVYEICSVEIPSKGSLANDASVWTNPCGPLTLITCLSQKDLPTAEQNVVVLAKLVGVSANAGELPSSSQ